MSWTLFKIKQWRLDLLPILNEHGRLAEMKNFGKHKHWPHWDEYEVRFHFVCNFIWNNGTKLSSSCSFPFDLFTSFIQKEQSFLFRNHFAKLRNQLWSTFALSWSFPKLFDCPHGRQHLLVYEIMWHLHLWPLLLAVPLKKILRKLIITTSS